MGWAAKLEIRALGLVALAACTIANPAYEGGASGSTGGLGISAADDREVGPEVSTAPTASSSTTTTGTTTGTGESGSTRGETMTRGGSTETEDEDPPPPEIGPFDPPVPVAIVNSIADQDDDPTLPADMLELYFASSRGGGAGDIYVARRNAVSDDWELPELVEDLSSVWTENTPEISADGLTMYFSSNRDELSDEDVFVSTRMSRMSDWSPPVRVAELSTMGNRDVCPFITNEELQVYLCRGNPDGPELDLMRFDRAGLEAPWSAGVPLVDVNTPDLECAAWLDPSERVLAFMSDREGGLGLIDLWLTSRPTADDPFEAPTPLVELNSMFVDQDPWISPDGGTVYFASERAETLDIYMAVRAQ